MNDNTEQQPTLPPVPSIVKSLHGFMGGNLQCCGNCNAFREDPGRKGGGVGLCCAHSPTVHISQAMVPSLGAGGAQVQTQLQSFWPPTEKRRWCREWQPLMEETQANG